MKEKIKRKKVLSKNKLESVDKKASFGEEMPLDNYVIKKDGAEARVSIKPTPEGKIYSLEIPEIGIGTQALLEDVRNNLTSQSLMGFGQYDDAESVSFLNKKFITQASKLFSEKVPLIDKKTVSFLTGLLMQEMLGLGRIEFLVADPALEEIVITSAHEPVRVYHKREGWLKTNINIDSEMKINNYANIIARRAGRQISNLNPLLDAHTSVGDRANAVLSPISTKGNTITIRKFARDPLTIVDLINNKTFNKEIVALLWLAVEFEMNILFSGGTASGKTSALNSIMPFMPPNHRLLTLEDTRELNLPEFLYWTPLVTRIANTEGKGEVTMLDLLVNALRMRPDRIVLGEIRRQREAEVLFEAMHTGHSVYATVHADTANETVRRLVNPPINVPPIMVGSVNLNVVMFRDRRTGRRRVFQLAEFIPGRDGVETNILYRWVPETDTFVKHNESLALFEELRRHTGLTEVEIDQRLKEKENVLEYLIKNDIRDLNSIGRIMALSYTDKAKFDSLVSSGKKPSFSEEAK